MFIGLDLGSRFVKMVYGSSIEKIIYKKIDTILFYSRYCQVRKKGLELNLSKLGKKFINAKKITACGYGKHIVKFKNVDNITELEAHVLGAVNMVNLDTFTLLDLGGQDTKVIQVKNKKMVDFIMNDRCAAGSGRYLENMSQVLNIPIDRFSKYYSNPIYLSNTCAIYGESEVISKIVEGYSVNRIASGVNYSIFNRIAPELNKCRNNTVVFTGGLANNKAIKYFIKNKLNKKVIVPSNPEYNGALGCFMKDRE